MLDKDTPVVKAAVDVEDDIPYPSIERFIEGQQSDQLVKLVSAFLADQELPQDEELPGKVKDFAEGYLLDGGPILKYFPSMELDEVSQNKVLKIVDPETLRFPLISLLYDTPLAGHLGGAKTFHRVARLHTWVGMRRDVLKYCKGCEKCQLSKPSTRPPADLMQHTRAAGPWSILGLDVMKPLPQSNIGNKYLLVVADYFTKWVSLFPLRDATVTLITEYMLKLCCRMGFPDAVLTVRGTQFTLELHQEM